MQRDRFDGKRWRFHSRCVRRSGCIWVSGRSCRHQATGKAKAERSFDVKKFNSITITNTRTHSLRVWHSGTINRRLGPQVGEGTVSGTDKAKNKGQELAGVAAIKGQELAGVAKETLGKVTGDKSIENAGKRDQAKANLKDAGKKVKGAGKKVREAGEKVADIFKSDPCGEKVKDAGEKVRAAGEKVADIVKSDAGEKVREAGEKAGEKVREAGEKAGESLANIFTSDEKVKDAGGEDPWPPPATRAGPG